MRILMLTTHFNCGGLSSYLLTLSAGLSAQGHKVIVASSGGDWLQRLCSSGIEHFEIPIMTKNEASWRVLVSFGMLLKFIRRNNIEVIHSHTRVTQVLATLLSRACSVSHVGTCHGFFRPKIFRRILPAWGKRTIAISQAVRDHLIYDLGVPADNIRVVYSGVPLRKRAEESEKTRMKARFGLPDIPVIGIIARLSDVKGHKYLLDAMPDILKEAGDVRLFMVGEGKTSSEIRALASALGISDKLRMVPCVSDTAEALSAMDVFVMPSLHEGLGLAVMEAMSAGLPVVASNVGGIPALIENGKSGILVEPRNSAALAEAVVFMLKNKESAAAMAACGAGFIAGNFSPEKMAQETIKVYQEALSSAK